MKRRIYEKPVSLCLCSLFLCDRHVEPWDGRCGLQYWQQQLSDCNGKRSPAMGKVSVKLSDPATCMAPEGPFLHVYVTITDIKAHASASAGDGDAGWQDLTPNLAANPVTVDLLGLANNQCFLGTLEDAQQLQAGNYQQLRVVLAAVPAVSSKSTGDPVCGSAANCVVLNNGSMFPLNLSSEAQTGIKITSGQIANGGFSVGAGEAKDLDIDFDTCASIVDDGEGNFSLKPVVHAGEVVATASSINGSVLDGATGKPINGTITVALEQPDAAGVDRIFMSTLAKADGTFLFCTLPMGTFDMVIVAAGNDGTVYEPLVVTGITTGASVLLAQLYADPATPFAATVVHGQVTSGSSALPAAGTVAHVELSALETVDTTLTATIPMVPNKGYANVTLARATAPLAECATGSDCVSYSMRLPAGSARVAAFSGKDMVFWPSGLPVSYVVDARASVPSSGGVADCTVSELKTSALSSAGGTASTLAFTGCR